MSFTPAEIAWAAFALFVGGFVKGIVGIGLSLVSMPLLTYGFSLKTGVAIMVLPMTTTNLFQAFQGGMFLTSLQRFWPLLLTLLIAVSLSTKLLVVLLPSGLATIDVVVPVDVFVDTVTVVPSLYVVVVVTTVSPLLSVVCSVFSSWTVASSAGPGSVLPLIMDAGSANPGSAGLDAQLS